MTRRRFPDAVYGQGSEPDPRFSLANERTMLAWIRTSLALVAAGVALEALALPMHPTLRVVTALSFIALGALAAIAAFFGWARAERAMRRATPLPAPSIGLVLAIGVVGAAIAIVVGFATWS
ncbi:DUF202 domain-containing protein [Agrococcus versicolor]|uniref:DUF202 domain-containing protein n=1 Tax=Agrococcus versicolor TaxID=501482 RepID=A0ABP5M8W4_9MICO